MFGDEITVMGKGKIRFEFGPASMVLSAWKEGEPFGQVTEACGYITECLKELSAQLTDLKKPWPETKVSDFYGIAVKLRQAVEKTGDETFTPMAAVAGTMSDFAADFLKKIGATKVIVNNGGDIALRMNEDDTVKVGIISSMKTGHMSRVLEIKGRDGISGICTSGLGGRSFTRGIADAVTVLSNNCSTADAFATYLANMTYVPSASVKRVKAGFFDPGSDIADLEITTHVGELSDEEIEKASRQLRESAVKAIDAGYIFRVYGYIGGKEIICEANPD